MSTGARIIIGLLAIILGVLVSTSGTVLAYLAFPLVIAGLFVIVHAVVDARRRR